MLTRTASFGLIASAAISLELVASTAADEWKPAKGPIATRWAQDLSPANAHRDYPRPQLVRTDWTNLNGLWDYAITAKDATQPAQFSGQILVPFPIESALSGVMKQVGSDQRLWYRRKIELPASSRAHHRILLHFGAVDWETTVWVNGHKVGEHRGGYDPFTFDITDALGNKTEAEIVVAVSDPTDSSTQPRGKQIHNPHGIWYTPTTGIWQTVWIEPVPMTYVRQLKIVPDLDHASVRITTVLSDPMPGDTVTLSVPWASQGDDDRPVVPFPGGRPATITGPVGNELELKLPVTKEWTPAEPWLYELQVEVRHGDQVVDHVGSYFGLRKIAIAKDDQGVTRMMLNNKFLFQYGPLDQGFWPDGLYTAPSDEALRYDIEMTKKLGFNMARKHVKVEPARWYYWCDRLGLLVWQDMPSGDKYIGANDPDINRSPESTTQFEREWAAIIEANYNHPAIVMWVPFNEGWGQFDTARIVEFTRKLDPTRLVDSASGWTDRRTGDVHDVHIYPGPGMPQPEPNRAAVLGEFGGLGLPVDGHTWQDKKNWGYRTFDNSNALTDAFVLLTRQLHPLVGKGLSAAVYTQTTDVEIEVNGLMTYDRAMVKMDAERITAANKRLYQPAPVLKNIVETSQQDSATWRFTTDKPDDKWSESKFDDSKWRNGPAGFGTEGTPGTRVRTRWDSPDIWIRRTFRLEAAPVAPWLIMHHDEDAEVYVNGTLVTQVKGYTTDYGLIPLTTDAARSFRAGDNTIAVHCHQTGGGQYIDVGVADEVPKPK